jgi:hypothetical protein
LDLNDDLRREPESGSTEDEPNGLPEGDAEHPSEHEQPFPPLGERGGEHEDDPEWRPQVPGAVETWEDHNLAAGIEPLGAVEAPPRKVRGLLWAVVVFMTVAFLGCLAASVKLYSDRSAAQVALQSAVTKLPQTIAAYGLDAVSGQLEEIKEDTAAGRFFQADERINNVRPAGGGGKAVPKGLLPTPDGLTPSTPEVSPTVRAFFDQHTDLAQRFAACGAKAKQLSDQGQDVQPLRDIRDKILAAAEAGDVAQVSSLLDSFAAKAGLKPGETAAVPDAVKAKFQHAGQAFQAARGQGKDLRKAAALMQRVQAAGQAGDWKTADELLDRAEAAIASAPRMAHPPMPRMGDRSRLMPPNMAQQGPGPQTPAIVRALIGILQIEDRDLRMVYTAIDNAASAVLGPNADQVKEYLSSAMTTLKGIGSRRRELSRQLNGPQKPRPASQSGGTSAGNAAQPTPEQRQGLLVRERIIAMLRAVRKLPEADFQKHGMEIANQLIGAMLPQQPTAEQVAAQERAGAPKSAAERATEKRVRAKLVIASQPYIEMSSRHLDTTVVDGYLAQARKALNSGAFSQAETAVDQALQAMGITPTQEQVNESVNKLDRMTGKSTSPKGATP